MINQADRILIGRPGDTRGSHWTVETARDPSMHQTTAPSSVSFTPIGLRHPSKIDLIPIPISGDGGGLSIRLQRHGAHPNTCDGEQKARTADSISTRGEASHRFHIREVCKEMS
ncbi:hypothetical protein ILYODFUR_021653 [Ilyodon furcidens]|uniref:Uncharacterized protein n=1 Tax=Ilyodon furcidens TaxID=33524 RepID=A0ABV0T9Z4_9TELE